MKINLPTLSATLLALSFSQLRAEEVAIDAVANPSTQEQNTSQVEDAQIQLQLDKKLEPAANTPPKDNNPATESEKPLDSDIKPKMSQGLDDLAGPNQVSGHNNTGTDTTSAIDLSNLAPGAMIIEGDRMEIYLDRKMKSIGNASILREKQNIYGDTIEYDVENEEVHVIGNTIIKNPGGIISGPELHMKLDGSGGEMRDATFLMDKQFVNHSQPDVEKTDAPMPVSKIGASRGDAQAIFFVGQDKKRLKDARYTTCEVGNDDWYIKAKNLDLDDYTKTAVAKNAYIDFKGVPILYTPWIRFPYLKERISGFLAPTWGTTSLSGFEFIEPFYWNISPDMDAILAARYLSKRGLQSQGEFRYLGATYSGIDNIEYLPNDSASGQNRYYLRFQHQQTFSNGISAGYQYEKVSDNQYFSDLSTRITTTSQVNLPQQANIAYNYGSWGFSALVQKFQTLDGVSYPYERLPQLTLNGNKDWGLTNADIKNEWVSFDRDPAAALVGTTAVTGNRFTTYPSISLPLAEPFGYITPKLGISHTSYSLSNPQFTLNGVAGEYASNSRTLPILSVDSGLFFDRNIQVVKNSYTQTLEPRMYYVYIPYRDQSMLPVFDSARADLNLGTLFLENEFVGGDRINNANQLSLAVTSRLIDAKTGEQRLVATLGQRFYFADEKVGLPGETLRTGNTSDIVAAATAHLINKWHLDTAWQYNTDTGRTVKANIGTRYIPEPGKVLNLSYRYTQDFLEQINISGQWPLGRGWYGVGRWNYSLRDNQPIEGLAGIEYDAGCWQARTVIQRVPTIASFPNVASVPSVASPANYAIFFQLELGGLASLGSNPLTLLNRSIPGYTNPGVLPNTYRQENYE